MKRGAGDHLDLVRFRNDGEDFHIAWTARRALRLLDPREGLVAIAVEGISARDVYRGRRVEAGLLVADTVEYFGAEALPRATSVVHNQLKYSTTRSTKPWSWSGLADTVAGFASRFSALEEAFGRDVVRDRVKFRFITNRPISPDVTEALELLAGGTTEGPSKRIRGVADRIAGRTSLSPEQFARFVHALELRAGEGGHAAQMEALAVETDRLLPRGMTGAQASLKELVRQLALSAHEADPTMRAETVLRAFGVDDPRSLMPAEPAWDAIENFVPRRQERELVDAILAARGPLLVTAEGGVGKSVIARRIADIMPPGSETVVFDCFAGGRYRNASEQRHRHDVALIHIANELSARGLCDPLLPTSAPDHALIRAFRSRLADAALIVGSRSAGAVVAIVVDAADNAVFAARERQDKAFVLDLMTEPPPHGVRMIAFARPERADGLDGGGPAPFELLPFDEDETASFARRLEPRARPEAVRRFHMLTFGNPRVQANQHALAGSIDEALGMLGPNGTTVDGMIEAQLIQGLENVRAAQPDADVDGLCAALAALPPFVPIGLLGRIAGVDPSRIRSFVADFGGGRPLMVRGDALQFRDEPVETWFIARFAPRPADAARFADRLQAIASDDPYAAAALPQLLVRAGRHREVISLALGGTVEVKGDHIQRRAVVLHRVRHALKSAFAIGDMTSVARLLIRAGEEVSATERQERFLEENGDQVVRLSSGSAVDDYVHRRRSAGSWFGATNVFKAEMLAASTDTAVEAGHYLDLAERWLDEKTRRDAEHADEFSAPEEKVNAGELASMLFAIAILHSPARAAWFVSGFQPGSFRFDIQLAATKKLLDGGRLGLVADLLAELEDPYAVLAVHLARERSFLRSTTSELVRSIAAIDASEISVGQHSYDLRRLRRALTVVAEEAFAHGLPAEALRMLERFEWTMPLDSHDLGDEIPSAIRALALRYEIFGISPDVVELWKTSAKGTIYQDDRPSRRFEATIQELLPTFRLRARAMAGLPVALPSELASARSTRTVLHFEDWTRRTFAGLKLVAEAETLALLGRLDGKSLADCISLVTRGDEWRLWPVESRRLIRLVTPLPELHPEAIELAASAVEVGEQGHEDAGTRADEAARLARCLLPISPLEAKTHFARGLEIADRVGDELHERLHLVLDLLRASSGTVGAEEAYRVLRLSEIYAQINDHKFPWHDVFRAIARADGPSALAGAGRLDSRGIVALDVTLPIVGDALLEHLGLPSVAALHVFGGRWQHAGLEEVVLREDRERGTTALGFMMRDAVDDARDAWSMRRLSMISKRCGMSDANFEAVKRQRETDSSQKWGGPRHHIADPDPGAVATGMNLLATCDMRSAEGVALAFDILSVHAPASSLSEVGALMASGLPVADWPDHIEAIAAADLSLEFTIALLDAAKVRWAASCAVRERIATAAEQLAADRAGELLAWAGNWTKHVPPLLALTGLDERTFLTRVANAAGREAEGLGTDALFAMARRICIGLLDPPASSDVLRFTLERFENVLKDDDGDGPYESLPGAIDDLHDAVAALIWTQLGDPWSQRRWRAAHAARRLAVIGADGVIRRLAERLEGDGPGSFVAPALPFYGEHARLQLLIAFAKVAEEAPGALSGHVGVLRRLAVRTNGHALQRYWAGQALLALARRGELTLGSGETRLLEGLLAIPAACECEDPAELRQDVGDDTRAYAYRLPYALDRGRGAAISRSFRLPRGQLSAMAAEGIREVFGREPMDGRRVDPRSAAGLYDRLRRNDGHPDTLGEYEAEHGVSHALARLIDRPHPGAGWGGGDWDDALPAHLFAHGRTGWLADRRDPTLASRRAWMANTHHDSGWRWRIQASDFEEVLYDGVGGFQIAGEWRETDGFRAEDVSIRSVIVRPEHAADLLPAFQTEPEGDFPWLPEDGEDWSDIGEDLPFRATPTASLRERVACLDCDDPLAGNIPAPVEPSLVLVRALGLSSDTDGRHWTGSRGAPTTLSSFVWGQHPTDRERGLSPSGRAMVCRLDDLVRGLTRHSRVLVVRVEVGRSTAGDRDPDWHVPPYVRFFVLYGSGRLEWLGGGRTVLDV